MFLKNTSILLLTALTLCCCCLLSTAQAASTTAATRSSTEATLLKKPDTITTETTKTNTSTFDRNDDNDNEDDDDDDGDYDDVKDSATAAGKHELEVVKDAGSLSIWSTLRGLWTGIRAALSESFWGQNNAVVGRTFGTIRRLQMALIPIVFKFGVLTAMVFFLVMMGMKTIFLLKVLMMMNIVGLVLKLLTLKSGVDHSPIVIHKPVPQWGWNPYPAPPMGHGGWAAAPEHHHEPSKEVHLHIHGAQVPSHSWAGHTGYEAAPIKGWESRNDVYPAYETASEDVKRDLKTEPDNSNSFLPIHYKDYQP